MLADGLIDGQQVGRAWVIERHELDRIRQQRGPVGRPWSAASAWAVLALANGDDPALSPVNRSRAKKRLAEHGLVGLSNRLKARADGRAFYGHPSVLARLADEPWVVQSGVSAAGDHRVDVVASEAFEGYVASNHIRNLIDKYGLKDGAERPNIILRVVDQAVWPFPADAKVASRPVVPIDLLDAPDERSRRAGAALAQGY